MSYYQVSFKLRKLAEKMGPDKERFDKLANSVEEFTTCLIDPLRSDKDRRRQFGDYVLDDLLNVAIENKQKKVTLKEKGLQVHTLRGELQFANSCLLLSYCLSFAFRQETA